MPTKKDPLNNESGLHQAIEEFYFAYRAFTRQPDRILAQRGLSRVHHRILYFVGHNREISINALLGLLKVSKQALNAPLKQLIEMKLVSIKTAEHDKRVRQLSLTTTGEKLEERLTETQAKLLKEIFEQVGGAAKSNWMQIMQNLSDRS